ncbi:hypothetical protein BGZ72_000908, partial [Mortierella alpina]
MKTTQLFRLIGTEDIVEIALRQINGQNVILWDDIEEIFPGVKRIMNGTVAINKLKDASLKRIEPHCIEHIPRVPLDIILHSPGDHPNIDPPAAARNLAAANDDGLAIALKTSDDQVPIDQCSGFQSTVIHKLDAIHDQGATTQEVVREVLKEQKKMNDRLILIHSKTEAILTQQLEIAEYPIPRLFIVLPEEHVKYDPANWFRTKFRLHFICECGKHTETPNSKIKHLLHLAKHEGYLVREPTKFFKKYGPFLILMLEMIKAGTAVAGHVVPVLATLQAIELVDSVKQSVELITAKIDLSLECIDRQLTKVQTTLPEDSINSDSQPVMTAEDLTDYLNGVEGVEGVELRQLRSFLKTSEDETLLGNLYRMTTSDGHVKWVCRDHYRASYQEKQVEKLREVVKLARGQFDEQLGKITITLTSSIEASNFYTAVSKAKGVLEFDISLKWECDKSDLEEVEEVLKNSRIAIVYLQLQQFRASRLLSTSWQYGALSRIKDLPQMRRLHIVLLQDLVIVKVSKTSSKRLSTPCRLFVDLIPKRFESKDLQALTAVLKTNATLTTLDLLSKNIGDNSVQALAGALKVNSTLTTLDLTNNNIEEQGGQALAEALKVNSTLTTLDLSLNTIGVGAGQAL